MNVALAGDTEPAEPEIKVYRVSGLAEQKIIELIEKWAAHYGYDDIDKARAIVSCEGGFSDPHICNKQYGCRAGQGHAQFIPSTWENLQKAIGVKDVFDSSDNIQALIYLLQKDGDRHWGTLETTWGSARCWMPKLK